MRVYKAPFDTAAAFTASFDFVELTPADDKPIVLVRLNCYQTTDLGDAAEEVLRWSVVRGNTTSGSGGTASTAVLAVKPTQSAAGCTYEALNSTKASAGTAVEGTQGGWNIRIPLDFVFLPEERDEASQANTLLCWRCDTAPADSITVGGGISLGEWG